MIGWLEDGLMCVLLFVDHLTALFRLFPLLYFISLLILITSISLSLRWPLPCQRVEVWIESLTSSVSVYLFQSNWLNRAIEFMIQHDFLSQIWFFFFPEVWVLIWLFYLCGMLSVCVYESCWSLVAIKGFNIHQKMKMWCISYILCYRWLVLKST